MWNQELLSVVPGCYLANLILLTSLLGGRGRSSRLINMMDFDQPLPTVLRNESHKCYCYYLYIYIFTEDSGIPVVMNYQVKLGIVLLLMYFKLKQLLYILLLLDYVSDSFLYLFRSGRLASCESVHKTVRGLPDRCGGRRRGAVALHGARSRRPPVWDRYPCSNYSIRR